MKNFIQWKGTDICMDFHCDCGHHNHYDGYFAYYVKCAGCDKVFKLNDSVEILEESNPDCDPLESEL